MQRCLISFGANLGDARATIQSAQEFLRTRLQHNGNLWRSSSFYKTPPVGGPSGQSPFVNAVTAFETHLSPWEVWHAIRQAEQHLGRERFRRWEARRIDIDILLFGQERIWTPQLKIPHPRMCMRRFILVPAREVVPDWIDPVSQWQIDQLSENLERDDTGIIVYASDMASAQGMVAEAAQQTNARWQDFSDRGQVAAETRWQGSGADSGKPVLSSGRWVAVHSHIEKTCDGHQSLEHAANLRIYLAPKDNIEGASWEDHHRDLAIQLRLRPKSTFATNVAMERAIVPGPRYLLATDDPQWAVHEVVAAFEAMDCPVERIHS